MFGLAGWLAVSSIALYTASQPTQTFRRYQIVMQMGLRIETNSTSLETWQQRQKRQRGST
jgi:hypothetical protein